MIFCENGETGAGWPFFFESAYGSSCVRSRDVSAVFLVAGGLSSGVVDGEDIPFVEEREKENEVDPFVVSTTGKLTRLSSKTSRGREMDLLEPNVDIMLEKRFEVSWNRESDIFVETREWMVLRKAGLSAPVGV